MENHPIVLCQIVLSGAVAPHHLIHAWFFGGLGTHPLYIKVYKHNNYQLEYHIWFHSE